VPRCRYPNASPDRIDGFLKVTPGAIRNIARGLSLHFRTVNIRSIVVESGALIENTRGVSQGEAPSRYPAAVPENTAPRASNIARDDIINARRERRCLTGNFTESHPRRVIFARLARMLPPRLQMGEAACPMNRRALECSSRWSACGFFGARDIAARVFSMMQRYGTINGLSS